MLSPIRAALVGFALIIVAGSVSAQVDDICTESGLTPSLDSPFAHVPYVYGRIYLKGYDPASKLPRITVAISEGQSTANRLTIGKSGNYCFRRTGGGGTIVVEVDGFEVARRSLPSMGSSQQREDFEIEIGRSLAPPAVVSTKFSRPPNEKTVDLYSRAAEAEKSKNLERAVEYLKQIVSIDPADFIAWAKLGSLYFERNLVAEADKAYRRSLELRVDYTPAWVNVGKLRVFQKQYEAAVQIFKHAIELEPTSARAYQLLGETYLLARQGTLGVEALNEALRLDPVGMAECHLQLAHLYELAGAKNLASREYKAFLTKVPNHPDKKKFEKFIKDNPEKPSER